MKQIEITSERLTKGTELLEKTGAGASLLLPADGGGILLPECIQSGERYLTFFLTVQEEHSMAFNWNFYRKGETEPAFTTRFGILGGVRSRICLDLGWTDAHALFPEASAGQQKVVCHGCRVDRSEIERVELVGLPCFHEVHAVFEELELTEQYPDEFLTDEKKRVDSLGQNCLRQWEGKTKDEDELKSRLNASLEASLAGYPFETWDRYGGWKEKKLAEGTGFFSSVKKDGRWWLADPDGYAFFSLGPDCVNVNGDCRVDGVEKWLEWLPEEDDPEYGSCYRHNKNWPPSDRARRDCTLFSFGQANLYRAFGKDWYEKWQKMTAGELKRCGFNTLGNWSDQELFGTQEIPYVTSLAEFPGTKKMIFRDFPDVFSEEYAQNAERCAQSLRARSSDPWMIGYFLRNEPSWAFVDNLVLADEVLHNPEQTACRRELITFLQEKYRACDALNAAWGTDLDGWDALRRPMEKMSEHFPGAREDLREFSRRMLRAYVEIPSNACRRADPNHMILGMRWAWISDPDLVTGWENFDVFSINCYAENPTEAIDNIVKLGVDLPVMIGEFHFGALDAGPTATGLEGVLTQKDRGIAYRFYCEQAAVHPNGVGCHWFQCYDQFMLGRFDGENYNIGIFDICLQPYPEMIKSVTECSRNIYEVAAGNREPFSHRARFIPMIAY